MKNEKDMARRERGRTFWEEGTQAGGSCVLPQRPVWPERWGEARADRATQGKANVRLSIVGQAKKSGFYLQPDEKSSKDFFFLWFLCAHKLFNKCRKVAGIV